MNFQVFSILIVFLDWAYMWDYYIGIYPDMTSFVSGSTSIFDNVMGHNAIYQTELRIIDTISL